MKKILAFLLALALLVTGFTCAFAEDNGSADADAEETVTDVSAEDEEEAEDYEEDAEAEYEADFEVNDEEGAEGTIEFLDENDEALQEPTEEECEPDEPFDPEEADKKIIGKDNRKTIKNPGKYPYSAIALLQIKFPCEKGYTTYGTAFMVSRNKALTAAHCLFCPDHRQWATQIVFNFGYRKGKGSVYRYTGGWKAHIATTFPYGYSGDNDWGVIKLDKNVGDRTGWFGMWPQVSSQIKSTKYYTAGYRDGKLKRGHGKLHLLDSKHYKFTIDTQQGNSGGPIFRKYKGGYYAVGIITTEWLFINRNSGVRLTEAIRKYVNKFK